MPSVLVREQATRQALSGMRPKRQPAEEEPIRPPDPLDLIGQEPAAEDDQEDDFQTTREDP